MNERVETQPVCSKWDEPKFFKGMKVGWLTPACQKEYERKKRARPKTSELTEQDVKRSKHTAAGIDSECF